MKTKKEQLKFLIPNAIVIAFVFPTAIFSYKYLRGYVGDLLSGGTFLLAFLFISMALVGNGILVFNLFGRIKSDRVKFTIFMATPSLALLWGLNHSFGTALVWTFAWMLSNLLTWVIFRREKMDI